MVIEAGNACLDGELAAGIAHEINNNRETSWSGGRVDGGPVLESNSRRAKTGSF